MVPWSCLHSKFTLSTYELSTFLLNVISNKVVAKIYTDLQVFTIYQRGICNFGTYRKPNGYSIMPGLLYIKPEPNAQSTINLINIENL